MEFSLLGYIVTNLIGFAMVCCMLFMLLPLFSPSQFACFILYNVIGHLILLLVAICDSTRGVKDSRDIQIHFFLLLLDLALRTTQSFLAFVDFLALFTFALSLLLFLFFFLSLLDSYHSDKKAGCRYEFPLASSLHLGLSLKCSVTQWAIYLFIDIYILINLCFYHTTK